MDGGGWLLELEGRKSGGHMHIMKRLVYFGTPYDYML